MSSFKDEDIKIINIKNKLIEIIYNLLFIRYYFGMGGLEPPTTVTP